MLLPLWCSLSAQTEFYVDHIGSEDGLTSQLCQHLAEDLYGNLWISSFNDVQKYDGYKVTPFPIRMVDERPLAVVDLIADQLGNMWILQGINEYDTYRNFAYNHYEYDINIIDPLTDVITSFSDYTNNILPQKDIQFVQAIGDYIYFITTENKIYRFKSALEFYADLEDPELRIIVNEKNQIISLNEDKIEVLNQAGQIIYQIDSTTISKYSDFVTSKTGKLFFIDYKIDHAIIYEEKNSELHNLITITKGLLSKNYNKYTAIEKFNNGSLLANQFYYDASLKTSLVLDNTSGNNPVFDYLVSRTGLGFIATDLGVYVYDLNNKLFKGFAQGTSSLNSVRALYINNKIIAYRRDKNETIIDKNTKVELPILLDSKDDHLATMHYIDPLNSNILWSCGYIHKQIRRINFKENEINRNYIFHPPCKKINGLHRSKQTENLYLSSNNGIYVLDSLSQEFYLLQDFDCVASEHLETMHVVDDNGKLLIASTSGVIEYDEKNRSCEINRIFKDSIKFSIQFIHKDKVDHDVLWLGSKKGGMIKWNTELNTLKIYNDKNGLSNNDVHAIIEDNQERLWVSTNRNLNCLTKKTDNILVFTEQDGITHSEFNRYSYFHDTLSNHIYFGGLDGYTYFNPDSINTSSRENNIELRLIAAKKIKSDASIEDISKDLRSTREINFTEEDLSIELNLATNHLSHPRNIEYSYKIPGLLDEWKSQTSRTINLNRVPYGDYKIEFVSDLKKPALTSDKYILDLKVIKPFGKTWFGRILLAVVIILFLWSCLQLYYSSLKQRNRKLEETISLRTKELRELNETKTKIFAILAHDLRNPISSLTNITEKIKFLSKQNRLDEIDILADQTKGKVNALNDNLNNILIWAINENNLLTQDPQKYSINLEAKKIISLYTEDIEHKNLIVDLNIDPIDQVFVDISILQTLLRNYIHNAIKFSYKDSKIKITKGLETANRMIVKIEDNGIGVKFNNHNDKPIAEEIRSIGTGSGIGMRICKDLATKANIELEIISKTSGGTIIKLDLPKNKDVQ